MREKTLLEKIKSKYEEETKKIDEKYKLTERADKVKDTIEKIDNKLKVSKTAKDTGKGLLKDLTKAKKGVIKTGRRASSYNPDKIAKMINRSITLKGGFKDVRKIGSGNMMLLGASEDNLRKNVFETSTELHSNVNPRENFAHRHLSGQYQTSPEINMGYDPRNQPKIPWEQIRRYYAKKKQSKQMEFEAKQYANKQGQLYRDHLANEAMMQKTNPVNKMLSMEAKNNVLQVTKNIPQHKAHKNIGLVALSGISQGLANVINGHSTYAKKYAGAVSPTIKRKKKGGK